PHRVRQATAAMLALGSMGDPRILGDAGRLLSLRGIGAGMLRGQTARALARLTPDAVLPVAREWRDSRSFGKQYAARRILAEHATADDIDWVRIQLRRPFRLENIYPICDAVQIATRIGEYMPEVGRVFDLIPYSYGRHFAAEALRATDPDWASSRAHTSLWDCEEAVRLCAAESVRLTRPSEARLREMAADQFEDERPRDAARARLASA
ncbi:MAG: hypothetical protein ACRDHF_18780, partial [Tepidiformaceae bacterium]